jgi:hypothetical protein
MINIDWWEIAKLLGASISGGFLWSFYLHRKGRIFQRKLKIDVKTSSHVVNTLHILVVEVQLTNTGNVKLAARRVGPNDYVYKDEQEQLRFSCSLQVRRVDPKKITRESYLDWFKCDSLGPVPHIPAEINLLDEYVVPVENDKIVFWLEPGDVVDLTTPLALDKGHYLLKISFYGEVEKNDFWSRLIHVCIE